MHFHELTNDEWGRPRCPANTFEHRPLKRDGPMEPGSSLTRRLRVAALQRFIEVNGSLDYKLNSMVIRQTVNHSKRVAALASRMTSKMSGMGWNTDTACEIWAKRLSVAALFHDIGKAAVSARILGKPSALDKAEYSAAKAHAALGAKLIDQVASGFPQSDLAGLLREVALCHHEKWDGTGYPSGLRGESIPMAARLVSVADAYDAIRYARVYKRAIPRSQAIRAIVDGAGSQFDPRMVHLFLSVVSAVRQK
ncbi:putative nucleotidyltransferase with HDIG domain [Paraburkholderia sp. JPY465]